VGVEKTFNRISVDGDMSTNDTVFVLANGAAGNGALSPEDFQRFRAGLTKVMDELSTMVVRDGEGATKLVRISIKGRPPPRMRSRRPGPLPIPLWSRRRSTARIPTGGESWLLSAVQGFR